MQDKSLDMCETGLHKSIPFPAYFTKNRFTDAHGASRPPQTECRPRRRDAGSREPGIGGLGTYNIFRSPCKIDAWSLRMRIKTRRKQEERKTAMVDFHSFSLLFKSKPGIMD